MEFNVNHPVLFVLVGIIIAVVLAQSVYFLVKSYRRAKEKGMDMTMIKKTIKTAAIFTIAPAISIVITVEAGNSLDGIRGIVTAVIFVFKVCERRLFLGNSVAASQLAPCGYEF